MVRWEDMSDSRGWRISWCLRGGPTFTGEGKGEVSRSSEVALTHCEYEGTKTGCVARNAVCQISISLSCTNNA